MNTTSYPNFDKPRLDTIVAELRHAAHSIDAVGAAKLSRLAEQLTHIAVRPNTYTPEPMGSYQTQLQDGRQSRLPCGPAAEAAW